MDHSIVSASVPSVPLCAQLSEEVMDHSVDSVSVPSAVSLRAQISEQAIDHSVESPTVRRIQHRLSHCAPSSVRRCWSSGPSLRRRRTQRSRPPAARRSRSCLCRSTSSPWKVCSSTSYNRHRSANYGMACRLRRSENTTRTTVCTAAPSYRHTVIQVRNTKRLTDF